MVKSGGHNPHLHKRLLHLRAENDRPGTDVEVDEFVMDDGVQIVALSSEAFDTAFGGKGARYNNLARETVDYIEVFKPSKFAAVASALYKSDISNSHLN